MKCKTCGRTISPNLNFCSNCGTAIDKETPIVEQPIKENTVSFCVNCGKELAEDFKFCPNCAESTATEKECKHCHMVVDARFQICPYCGEKLKEEEKIYSKSDVEEQKKTLRTDRVSHSVVHLIIDSIIFLFASLTFSLVSQAGYFVAYGPGSSFAFFCLTSVPCIVFFFILAKVIIDIIEVIHVCKHNNFFDDDE